MKAKLLFLPFILSLFRVLVGILNEMGRLRCRFCWGFKDGERGMTWVNWKNYLASLEIVVLRIGSMKGKNFRVCLVGEKNYPLF